jgi:hypothetical protein
MSQSQLDKIEDTLNDLRDDLAVLIALSPSDVVEEASKIVVNEAYSRKELSRYVPKIHQETHQASEIGQIGPNFSSGSVQGRGCRRCLRWAISAGD